MLCGGHAEATEGASQGVPKGLEPSKIPTNAVAAFESLQKPSLCIQIFVTSSEALRDQAQQTFYHLLAAVIGPEAAQEKEGRASAIYMSFRDVPEDVYVLFLTRRQELVMLDGSLPSPFFPRYFEPLQ